MSIRRTPKQPNNAFITTSGFGVRTDGAIGFAEDVAPMQMFDASPQQLMQEQQKQQEQVPPAMDEKREASVTTAAPVSSNDPAKISSNRDAIKYMQAKKIDDEKRAVLRSARPSSSRSCSSMHLCTCKSPVPVPISRSSLAQKRQTLTTATPSRIASFRPVELAAYKDRTTEEKKQAKENSKANRHARNEALKALTQNNGYYPWGTANYYKGVFDGSKLSKGYNDWENFKLKYNHVKKVLNLEWNELKTIEESGDAYIEYNKMNREIQKLDTPEKRPKRGQTVTDEIQGAQGADAAGHESRISTFPTPALRARTAPSSSPTRLSCKDGMYCTCSNPKPMRVGAAVRSSATATATTAAKKKSDVLSTRTVPAMKKSSEVTSTRTATSLSKSLTKTVKK